MHEVWDAVKLSREYFAGRRLWLVVRTEKIKSERSDGEARRGLGVNESFRPDESDEKSAHPCAETDVF
jgi:hypothetical protein